MWSRLPTLAPCIPPHQPCHFCKLKGVEIRNKRKKKSLHDCGRRGRAPSFSLPLLPLTLTHTNTQHSTTHTGARRRKRGEKTHTVACFLLLRVEARHSWFHSKTEEMEEERGEWGKEKRRERGGEGGRKGKEGGRGEKERERERERGKKKKTSTQKMLTFGSPQLSPPVKIGGVRFRGLLLCVTRQRKGGGKKKNVIRRGVTRQSLPRFVSWSGCKTSVVNLP